MILLAAFLLMSGLMLVWHYRRELWGSEPKREPRRVYDQREDARWQNDLAREAMELNDGALIRVYPKED